MIKILGHFRIAYLSKLNIWEDGAHEQIVFNFLEWKVKFKSLKSFKKFIYGIHIMKTKSLFSFT